MGLKDASYMVLGKRLLDENCIIHTCINSLKYVVTTLAFIFFYFQAISIIFPADKYLLHCKSKNA